MYMTDIHMTEIWLFGRFLLTESVDNCDSETGLAVCPNNAGQGVVQKAW